MSCSRHSSLEKLASAMVDGAMMELHLTPKPGLVDRLDSGSHRDLSLSLMERSIAYLAHYMATLVASLKKGEGFIHQQAIAVHAEQSLMKNLGTNTHKGYLFLSGMLLIAQWHASSLEEKKMRNVLSSLAESFFLDRSQPDRNASTHGQRVRQKFKAGGIVREAIDGYPSLFESALPVYRRMREEGGCPETAAFTMFARLMQVVDDTTTLHRCGPAGLARIKLDGQLLEQMIWQGEEFRPFLIRLNATYKHLNLTIGGVADMLGIGFGYLIAKGEIAATDRAAVCLPEAA